MRKMGCMLFALLLIFCLALPGVSAAPEVSGKASCLMDIHTGQVLFEENAHTPLPPASVTKIMTMLLVMEALQNGSAALTDMVTASENAAAKGGSQIFLKAGETMALEEMLKSVAVSSANDCACALAEHIAGSESAFVDRMNARAAELGMTDTHFVNCTGLDDDPAAKDHLTSAYDIAVMSRQLLKYHPNITEYTTIWMDTVRSGAFGLSNTNKLVRFYSGATGLKTGFTSGAGYCLSASAQRDDLGLVAVVMGAETSKDRFNTCRSLLDYGFATYALAAPELPETAVPVKLGTSDTIRCIPREDTALLVEKAQRAGITAETELLPEITAPVSQGQKLGTLTIKSGTHILKQIPLVAETAVPKLTLWQMFSLVLKNFLGAV